MSEIIGVGIDLGATYSRIAVYQGGQALTCHSDDVGYIIDEYSYFKYNAETIKFPLYKYEITIYDLNRLLGKSFDDPTVKEVSLEWPIEVIETNGRLKIQIRNFYRDDSFFLEEICGTILSRLKEHAKEKTGKNVERVVITVPAYFTDAQRQATIAAASLAGLNVLRIVNKPTAAAFAFNMTNSADKERFILVFKLGSRTLDVSILKICKKRIRVLATAGDDHLGGVDFDETLMEHCIKVIEMENKLYVREYGENSRMHIDKLRIACNNAKIKLSTAPIAMIVVDRLCDRLDYQTRIDRSRFEMLNKDLFQRCMDIVDRCIDMVPSEDRFEISRLEIELVGGSTHIPKIMELLKDKFPNQPQHTDFNRDELVVRGAAFYAHSILTSELSEVIDDALIGDTPMFSASRGPFYKIIDANNMGPLLIFNHVNFDNASLKERRGTHKDVDALKQFCTAFGFSVSVHEDNSRGEFLENLRKGVATFNPHVHSSFGVCILSHGGRDLVHARDGELFLDDIKRIVLSDRLKNKPKLMIIQACRGSAGAEMLETDSIKLPNPADLIIFNSTVAEYVSYRYTDTGSIFIQTLCKHLLEHGDNNDICVVFKNVTMEISRLQCLKNLQIAQVPETTSTFRKQFILKKKK